MFCPKCAFGIENNENICPNCKIDLTSIEESKDNTNEKANGYLDNKKSIKVFNIKIIISTIISILIFIIFLYAANEISESGKNIMNIQSVGGKTLEEAYYFELGRIYGAYAMISRAIGIFFSAIILCIGIKK